MIRPPLVTRTWECLACDHRARVSADREAVAEELIRLVVAGHAQAGCSAADEAHSGESP